MELAVDARRNMKDESRGIHDRTAWRRLYEFYREQIFDVLWLGRC